VYQKVISGGGTVMGIPVWAGTETLSVTVDDSAFGVDFILGGLGQKPFTDVDKEGIIYTCILCYGVPSFLIAATVGAQQTSWYKDFFKDQDNVVRLVAAGVAGFGFVFAAGSETIGIGQTLAKAADIVGGGHLRPRPGICGKPHHGLPGK
jgi:hypothetical protein